LRHADQGQKKRHLQHANQHRDLQQDRKPLRHRRADGVQHGALHCDDAEEDGCLEARGGGKVRQRPREESAGAIFPSRRSGKTLSQMTRVIKPVAIIESSSAMVRSASMVP
jgi:hypothetical protein